jgi:hypothetical protein
MVADGRVSACAFDQLHDIYQLHLVKFSDILIGIREEKNLVFKQFKYLSAQKI